MDAQPGPSASQQQESDFCSPRKKRPRGAFSRNEKTIILNVYKSIIESWPHSEDWSATDCAKKMAEMTGVSLASVYAILKQYKLSKDFENPKTSGPRLSFKDKLDEFTFSTIRIKFHQFFYRNEMPTIEKVIYSSLSNILTKLHFSSLYVLIEYNTIQILFIEHHNTLKNIQFQRKHINIGYCLLQKH